MAKRKRETGDESSRPADPETEEKRRLRSLAFSRKLLLRSSSQPSTQLGPSKAVVKLQGRDIVKRGQRKSRYLFSFPGLLAPLSSGRIGELADLGTKNPVLYLEFPQGRVKLFGTHVYPKNKYLTLQLTKSAKGVICEDVFESMIVFSDAWWIGEKVENPQEKQLEFPKCFTESDKGAIDYDFKGGAGSPNVEQTGGNKFVSNKSDTLTPETKSEATSSEDFGNTLEEGMKSVGEATPVRQSARTAGKRKLSYAESSGDDSPYSDAEVPELMDEKVENLNPTPSGVAASISELAGGKTCSTENIQQTAAYEETEENPSSRKGTLVQATLSNLFEKASDKKPKRCTNTSPATKGSGSKRQRATLKKLSEHAKKSNKKETKQSAKKSGNRKGTMLQPEAKVPMEPEEISNESQDDSDEDWAL